MDALSQNIIPVFIACMVLGAMLMFAEKLMPKGVFGITGGVLLTAGIALGYYTFDTRTATFILAATVGGLMVSFTLWARYFPGSRMAKAYIATGSVGEVDRSYRDLVGQHGTARTPLRPAGKALINGRDIDVVAEGGFVEPGTPIEVITAGGNRVVVRPSVIDDSGDGDPGNSP